jgi:hypothetical protein
MMTTLICTQCSEPKCVTSRGVVLPFVCDSCQKDAELLAAMAPASTLKIEKCDNIPYDSATVDNTTLLIEDQANQLALALNEVQALRQVNQYLEAREAGLVTQNARLQDTVENLLVKNFFKDEEIADLLKQNNCLGVAVFRRELGLLGKLKDAGIKA